MNNLSKIEITKEVRKLSKLELFDLQKALRQMGYSLAIDGIYGNETKTVFNRFKRDNALTHPDLIGQTTINFILNKLEKKETDFGFEFLTTPQTVNGKLMIVKMPTEWQQKALSNDDFVKLADVFKIDVPSVKAVMEIESNGSGFLLNESAPCRPKILFEGHIFYRQTSKPVSKTRPDLSYPSWTKRHYKGGSAEWGRLLDAMEFDPIAAVKSASWGLGQIMGFNHGILGYDNVEDMIIDAHKGEYYQAKHIFKFCQNHPSGKLMNALKAKNWTTFAYYYNGAGYAQNQYDIKLRNAYLKHSRK
jgi:peptidoglycan hydrolase-like protein with peptidoglycan-binding domain